MTVVYGTTCLCECDVKDYRRRYNLDPVVKDHADVKRQRAITEEDCPECGHHGLEFYTMQVRSERAERIPFMRSAGNVQYRPLESDRSSLLISHFHCARAVAIGR